MEITFLGGVGTVTGSKYVLDIAGKRVLIDCGLFQGLKALRLRNWAPLPIKPASVDAVLLTHAHIDHSGYLPLFVKNGFVGPVFCTTGTADLCEILLPDSAHLQMEEAEYANRHGYSKHHPALPLYTVADAERALKQLRPVSYRHHVTLGEHMLAEFLPMGHIVGASAVRIQSRGKTITFSGDVGRMQDVMMKSPIALPETDFLVLESTYGDRLHAPDSPEIALQAIIHRTYERGGTVLIPAFAVGRAQLMLYYLSRLKAQNALPPMPIYLDSPMAINSTLLLTEHGEDIRLTGKDCHALNTIAAFVRTPEESRLLNTHPDQPKIIIAASGMMTGGRVLHHLKTYAPYPKNTLLFTGFQAEETRGRRILRGEKTVRLLGESVAIRAEVASISNLSAHADQGELLSWLKQMKRAPERVFITHGEPNASLALKSVLETELGWQCVIPRYQERLSLL
ncbi:MAG: mRNA 3'-end processing factor [Gammaproteobacteria bacterium RIFCSPHIGHO2_12_FULL_45_9]|nr:MAG: mRNA 3'-end processing factor [Gammaproteobacteria bacterium RIFCSPHIGHO2_12_FULL_45_9]